ncbi:MAG: HNH endonuclease [Ktedonobacteraceae bacterium]
MPMDWGRYPTGWRKISRTIRRVAGYRCEWCGVPNGAPLASGRLGGVVLTVAHLGAPYANGCPGDSHDKHDVRRENLACLCQRCHLRYDLEEHIQHAKATRQRKAREQAHAAGQLELFPQGQS